MALITLIEKRPNNQWNQRNQFNQRFRKIARPSGRGGQAGPLCMIIINPTLKGSGHPPLYGAARLNLLIDFLSMANTQDYQVFAVEIEYDSIVAYPKSVRSNFGIRQLKSVFSGSSGELLDLGGDAFLDSLVQPAKIFGGPLS
ncbi:MAG TPA: hypothetical protein VF398_06695 [bacterium]